MLEIFYSTVAYLCFGLLGLWWVVVQFKHHEWMRDPGHRRMAYDLSLYFLLPGIMSLVSLLAVDVKILWRVGFSLAAILGAIETAYVLFSTRSEHTGTPLTRLGHILVFVLYVLIALVAIDPTLVTNAGLGLKPIEVEGILIVLLLFLGVNMVWAFFAQPVRED